MCNILYADLYKQRRYRLPIVLLIKNQGLWPNSGVIVATLCWLYSLPDTSAPGHFGTKTVRHQYRMVPKCLETIRHQIFTGAELSGHFGTSAEMPRDTSAPSVKNTYDMGYCFVRIGLLLVTMPRFADLTTSPAVSNRQSINLMTCVKFLL